MREPEKGMFARSLAGHDKGKWYLIQETDGQYLYLTDGKSHPSDRPKKKKRMHVQPALQVSGEALEALALAQPRRDEIIRKLIREKQDKEE